MTYRRPKNAGRIITKNTAKRLYFSKAKKAYINRK
ncbi:hypothetical protein FHR32_002215 [Streptosporangium album]|uniref:Uncharacterized protein n=1 Tax=Streptosporangium album TaxID=47479 RepID=A0A7W7RTG1_9ACTN|nr:hypothetical protein [Streptosporangium album]